MDKNKQWIDLIVELQGLAQAGLTYGKDVYDKERYERIRDISAEMMAELCPQMNGYINEQVCQWKK